MLFGNADWRKQVGAEIPSQQWLSIFSTHSGDGCAPNKNSA